MEDRRRRRPLRKGFRAASHPGKDTDSPVSHRLQTRLFPLFGHIRATGILYITAEFFIPVELYIDG